MKIFNSSNIPKNYKRSALAIGNFDGVHKGHQKVFKETRKLARKNKIKFGVLTFSPLPVMFFNKKAIIIGKPEKKFFDLVLKDMNLPINQIVMVGDDIISDIAGAKKNNILAVQVKTGKYQKKRPDPIFQVQ